jgi:hypothetical protein
MLCSKKSNVMVFALLILIGMPLLTSCTFPVRDVDNPDRQPFQWFAFPQLPENTLGTSLDPILVPADKRLVIEFVSATAIIQATGQIAEVGLSTTVNSNVGNYRVPLNRTGTVTDLSGTQERFQGSQQMRVYADPGTQVQVSVGRTTPGSGIADFSVSISGYLVNAP